MNDSSYSRRNFIKVAGLVIGALLIGPIIPLPSNAPGQFTVLADASGKKYLGTRNGLVFESTDGGKTWQQVANFGSHCAVQGLSVGQDRLHARIGVGAYAFALTSTDARTWHTA